MPVMKVLKYVYCGKGFTFTSLSCHLIYSHWLSRFFCLPNLSNKLWVNFGSDKFIKLLVVKYKLNKSFIKRDNFQSKTVETEIQCVIGLQNQNRAYCHINNVVKHCNEVSKLVLKSSLFLTFHFMMIKD